jgi:hypothetical protein
LLDILSIVPKPAAVKGFLVVFVPKIKAPKAGLFLVKILLGYKGLFMQE